MANHKSTSDNDDQRDGGTDTPVKTPEKKQTKKVKIKFKQNRSFDLHVGRKVLHFGPNETKEVDGEIIAHADFKQVANYFVIKE